jgi:holo-[acyl-carrier protein] synthase
MIKGLGIDIESIARVKKAAANQDRFIETILTVNEIKQYRQLVDLKADQYLASRYSAKESYSKAAGTGIGADTHWLDIEILNQANGAPKLTYQGHGDGILVAISHKDDYVITEVIIEN